MEPLLKEEYFHFGTDNIYFELWHNIINYKDEHYSKPIGGLWTSHQNNYNLCDWLQYIENKNPFDFDLYVGNKKSSLIKFKEDTKFLKIMTTNDFENLKQSGFVIPLDKPISIYGECNYLYIHELLDYEKLSMHYDLIYVEYFVHECFRQFSINTMLALNPNSIEYYKPLIVDYLNHEIINIGDKKQIAKPTKGYYIFLNYVKNIINDIKANSYEEFIIKLNKLKDIIINDLIKNFNFNTLELSNDIDKEHLIYSVVNNEFNKKIKEIQKNLHN